MQRFLKYILILFNAYHLKSTIRFNYTEFGGIRMEYSKPLEFERFEKQTNIQNTINNGEK